MDVKSLFDVAGKVVLVTGGGRGVGEMIATGYVANGGKVYISSRDAKACEATAARLTALGPGTCVAIPADLGRYDECVRLAAELEKREDALHVLVNNSGVAWGAPLESYPDDAFAKVLNLNVQRVFTLTQKLVPLLERGSARDGVGRIINIGSINGIQPPVIENYAYSASKAALHQLSKHLALRLSPAITVNTLALGPFRSRMMRATLDAFEDEIAGALPMRRIGEPADVAAACLWLSSRGGAWITGTVVPIEGGHLVAPPARL
ncbi:hypothetical protein Q5752_002432 [Cryptotrichosporon argae]